MADDELEGASWMGGRPGVGVCVGPRHASMRRVELNRIRLHRYIQLPRYLTSSRKALENTTSG